MTQLEGTHVHLGTVLGILDTRFNNDNTTFTPPPTTGNDGGDLNSCIPLAGPYGRLPLEVPPPGCGETHPVRFESAGI
jgi:hypothetical protein